MKLRYCSVILLVIALVLCGCTQPEEKVVKIYGSGATFPQPQIEKWISLYEKVNPNIKIEYVGKGSKEQNDFKEGLVDFAATNPPVKESTSEGGSLEGT